MEIKLPALKDLKENNKKPIKINKEILITFKDKLLIINTVRAQLQKLRLLETNKIRFYKIPLI